MTKIIGLTGPTGAGKDEVAKILQESEALIISADEIVYLLLTIQSPVSQKAIKAFGSKILNKGGKVDTKKLAKIVYSDTQKFHKLKCIVLPYLKEAIIQIVKNWKQKLKNKKQLIIINTGRLKEMGLANFVDETWVVVAPKDERLKRQQMKLRLSKKEAQGLLSVVVSQKEYLEIGDIVIRNDGSISRLKRLIVKKLLAAQRTRKS